MVYAIAVTTHICDGDGRKPVANYWEGGYKGLLPRGNFKVNLTE